MSRYKNEPEERWKGIGLGKLEEMRNEYIKKHLGNDIKPIGYYSYLRSLNEAINFQQSKILRVSNSLKK